MTVFDPATLAIMAQIGDAVITADSADRVTFMNGPAETLTGWRVSEARGEPLSRIVTLIQGVLPQERTRGTLSNKAGLRIAIEYSLLSIPDPAQGISTALIFRDLLRRGLGNEVALSLNDDSVLEHADALFEEKERAQVTLNSIGDAVISTDFRGCVSYLNMVAEKMTGWTQADAAGQAIGTVFKLVDAVTREPVSCLTTRSIIENVRVGRESTCMLVRRDGLELAVEDSAAPIHDRNGSVIGAVMVAHDVTMARELTSKLARLALHDSLTEIPNRVLFDERLNQAMRHAQASGNAVALLYVDLDRFKSINDTLGHAIGDQLLQIVARRLLACVRSSDTVSRLGGDEFGIVLSDVVQARDAATCADKLIRALNEPYQIGDHGLCCGASIGIALYPADAVHTVGLLKCADLAMYDAKSKGRNGYEFFRRNIPTVP